MDTTSTAMLSRALELEPADRERLAGLLWDSLDMENDLPAIPEAEFLSETATRRDGIFCGKVATISHQELKRQLGR